MTPTETIPTRTAGRHLAPTAVEAVTVTGAPSRDAVPLVVAALAERWDLAGPFQVRTLHVVRTAGRVQGVAFTVHRPLTAYEKVAGWWLADDEAAPELLAAVVSHARGAGAVVVKVELDERSVAGAAALAATARAAGFADVAAPLGGASFPQGPHDVPAGLALWLDGGPAPTPVPYYRQTTELTCGPVALGTAFAAEGDVSLLARQAEIDVYREVNTVVGSDPFGLAVAAAARGHRPRVLISTADPILLECVPAEWDRDTRAFIQRGFRDRALAAGLAVETRDFGVDEVVAHVAAGGTALVLIDQHPMHAEPCPHWITLHAVRGGVVVANDPWTDSHLGESWLDGADLPLPVATLDRIAQWGEPAYRAALLFDGPRREG
ncbi:peptidase C39 family protein [Xylanimonas sp. McL0601]|uniref:peptidase C39 family protein n=1 Tax=Xylanimonas sp. McL0601 TaxID=3414739 RepID=UPI003CFAEE77